MSAVLVTGGAGYIGSHVTRLLAERGETVVVVDNLSTGFADAVMGATLIEGNVGDQALMRQVIAEHDIDAVCHFAAHIVVPESVEKPLKYYGNNTANTRALLEVCDEAGVKHFIFSSTAAVYGAPKGGIASEDSPLQPINPYGWSKLMSEQMLKDLSHASSLKHVILRYFNVAGAEPEGRLGQSTPQATHLIKVAAEHVVGQREGLAIFGDDYDTPDGTCVRDYIHVEDLALAHLAALDYLRQGQPSRTLNCGYGRGHSVKEVLEVVERVAEQALNITQAPRRAGDPATLIAQADRIVETLDWAPRFDDIEGIVRSALNWERRLAAERSARP
ncbi:MAG: UDP-glucose 4-epimerase GalE [Wenzhouxiangella sp.]|nr:UDP-glucose 4-epimerase GalE [Wenzhouxiangella sp.]